ncbi:MAG TPA: 50S ribosomal protein L10 [Patescibacteria group bacterium]|nr:50S ribosomal protein L10 [Patescibacteria group bacterium]
MNDKKVSKNRVKKEGIVAKLIDKKAKAKAMIFTNYQGLTHKQIEELKKGIKTADAEFVVAKNSLLQKAFTDIKKLEELEGPTGTIFAYSDVVAPLKQVAKTLKQFNLPTIKFGILEGIIYDSEQVLKISSLPTKDVLIAQFVGGMKAPLYGLHRALSWNLQKLVMTLQAISDKKQTTS